MALWKPVQYLLYLATDRSASVVAQSLWNVPKYQKPKQNFDSTFLIYKIVLGLQLTA